MPTPPPAPSVTGSGLPEANPSAPDGSIPSDDPDPRPPAAELARQVCVAAADEDWAGLETLWSEQLQDRGLAGLGEAVPTLADLPEDARRRFPLLTWARAAALGQAADPEDRERVAGTAMLRDAVTLHSGWQQLPDLDAAVQAGTMWLAGQQSLNRGRTGTDAVWTTRDAIAAHIERHRLAGTTPADATAASFHAKSAQLALLRADIERCIAEADQAILLQQRGPAGRIAQGVRGVALELQGAFERVDASDYLGEDATAFPDRLGVISRPAWLARAARGLRLLDRETVEGALARLSGLEGEPLWPIRIVLTAVSGAIWGDAEEALLRLHRDLARNAVTSLEHHEPISRFYLTRVRALLLCHISDPAAALEQLIQVPHPWDWAPRARALLWAGDLDGAILTAREGLLVDPDTWQTDRLHLSVIVAAALASRRDADGQDREREFWRAINACTEARNVTALAHLPSFATTALLDLHDELCDGGCILCEPTIRLRLDQLPASGRGSQTLIRLTPREKELLPLLAGELTASQIARQLHLSVGTVRKQVATLRGKFDAHSREELVRSAAASGHLSTKAARRRR